MIVKLHYTITGESPTAKRNFLNDFRKELNRRLPEACVAESHKGTLRADVSVILEGNPLKMCLMLFKLQRTINRCGITVFNTRRVTDINIAVIKW